MLLPGQLLMFSPIFIEFVSSAICAVQEFDLYSSG